MSYEDWPALQESDIQALATAKVFARGRALFDEDALEDLTRQGEKLSALCQGSEDESYCLSVRINEQGIQATQCTCPYEYDGLCKHLVALLLAWAHGAEAFQEVEATQSSKEKESALLLELREKDRDELARVIIQLVETEPKLRAVVRRLLQNRLSDSEVAKTQKGVETLMRKALGAEYGSEFTQVRRDLTFHLRSAASFEARRPSDAGRLYIAILQGLMTANPGVFSMDDNGHLVGVSQQCIAAVGQLLSRVSVALRAQWLNVVCQAYLFEFQTDSYSFAEGADTVLESAGPEEWKAIVSQLDEFLKPPSHEKRNRNIYYDEWGIKVFAEFEQDGREEVVELKAKLLAKFDSPDAAHDFLLEQGTPEQKVDTYLADEDFDAATHIARQSFLGSPCLIRSFALSPTNSTRRASGSAPANGHSRTI